ncbi:hypothetical protein [Flavihumibacter profundi]|uniref:hypothetical protein n=1 Tax=Flavihumibacter profundi TaxID=2716883 RepID=UPI001CC8063F|nr:hypothetical protein [Flavihumibacter profundi]MBZ5858279.1 hypothetical protein [Flavihumibacter profundi]
MKIGLFVIGLLFFTGQGGIAQAPKVVYSQPERDDTRQTNFEIMGKLGNDVLVYKNNRSNHKLSVYDSEMALKENVDLDFFPDKTISMQYITYPDKILVFFEYQRKRVVYCDYVVIGAGGKIQGPPVTLDTTEVSYSSSNKIYNVINSDDKQKIMLFKVNSGNPRRFIIASYLFNSSLDLITRSQCEVDMGDKDNFFSDFHLSNKGELVVAKFIKSGSTDIISGVSMLIKHPDSLGFSVQSLNIGKLILDNVQLKVDNGNNRVLMATFFSRQKRGNMEGIYVVGWDKSSNQKIMDTTFVFNDELRNLAKGEEGNKKTVFNDFFIKNIYSRKDGGFVIVSESLFTSSRNNSINRWDYGGYGNPWMSPMNYSYWSPMYSPWSMPWTRYGYNNSAPTRYLAENILVLSFDKSGALVWNNVIAKSQFEDDTDNLISYGNMNTGGEVHFLFNTFENRTFVLTDQSMDPTGKITRFPTLKNLDKGYEFMPRFGKQVSARQMIIPCMYRSYLCFARIDF